MPLAYAEPGGSRPPTKDTEEVERPGVDAVLAVERGLGRRPVEQDHWNAGFDITSQIVDGGTIFLEVKARLAGSKEFEISRTEVLFGKTAAPNYRLALVTVSPEGPEHDEVRYLDGPFRATTFGDFNATVLSGDWKKEWSRGRAPF